MQTFPRVEVRGTDPNKPGEGFNVFIDLDEDAIDLAGGFGQTVACVTLHRRDGKAARFFLRAQTMKGQIVLHVFEDLYHSFEKDEE